jgi:hypothetical protein
LFYAKLKNSNATNTLSKEKWVPFQNGFAKISELIHNKMKIDQERRKNQ